jgi:leucyl-tRNA synthetase
MILGFSYRYYDDNLSDDPNAKPRSYSFRDVVVDGERVTAADDGRELTARWVAIADVRKRDGRNLHPTLDVELEEVVEKMSKSRGNVISPDDVIAEFGADSMRLYEMFIGPLDKDAPWSTEGIQGVRRFLERVWRTLLDEEAEGTPLRPLAEGDGTPEQARLTARVIAGVTDDLDAMRFNTAISKLMVFAKDVVRDAPLPRRAAEVLVLLVSPLAPHLGEELWQRLGHAKSLAYEPWPTADPALLVDSEVTLVVQVNGKKRDEVRLPADAGEAAVREAALALESVRKHLDGRAPKKVVVVPGRLVNVVG